ncbi:hypothetical protein TRIUR3_28100 [Triticum urartu]|uniref:Uncharacterized protein n=1 Tax=Triticum urartu TaxID=4572 RepID=M8AXX0_TRIUA|nr:hypothetical protein TRIUR3_28100 [Triticum urartu]
MAEGKGFHDGETEMVPWQHPGSGNSIEMLVQRNKCGCAKHARVTGSDPGYRLSHMSVAWLTANVQGTIRTRCKHRRNLDGSRTCVIEKLGASKSFGVPSCTCVSVRYFAIPGCRGTLVAIPGCRGEVNAGLQRGQDGGIDGQKALGIELLSFESMAAGAGRRGRGRKAMPRGGVAERGGMWGTVEGARRRARQGGAGIGDGCSWQKDRRPDLMVSAAAG